MSLYSFLVGTGGSLALGFRSSFLCFLQFLEIEALIEALFYRVPEGRDHSCLAGLCKKSDASPEEVHVPWVCEGRWMDGWMTEQSYMTKPHKQVWGFRIWELSCFLCLFFFVCFKIPDITELWKMKTPPLTCHQNHAFLLPVCFWCCLVTQWGLTLCDPMDCSLPGFSVHGISRQEYWSELPFPSPEDLPNPGIKAMSLASPVLTCVFFTTEPPRKLLPLHDTCQITSDNSLPLMPCNMPTTQMPAWS